MREFTSEEREMSSVAELQMIAREVADFSAPSGGWKVRVRAVAHALGLEWGRAKGAYYGQIMRVDAEEMDRARKRLREIRARVAAREQARQFSATAAYLRQVDPDFHRHTIAHLEHAVFSAGDVAGIGTEE